MSGPGYGRGGRGAALLQALNQPVRKPGGSPTEDKEKVAVAVPGRGAMLQALLQKHSPGPSPSVAGGSSQQMPQLSGGRGMLLQQALAKQVTPAQSPAKPMGRGAQLSAAIGGTSVAGPKVSPPAPKQASPTVVSSQPAPATGVSSQPAIAAGGTGPEGPDEASKLERMLQRINLEEAPVIKTGKSGEQVPLCVNYIPVICKNEGVFQYACSFDPIVDSKMMRGGMLYEHKDVIGETKAFDGAILFLPIRLKEKETILKSKRITDSVEVTIKIKLVKVLPPASCIQLYNVIFRKIMTILQMCQVGRHYYDPNRPAEIPQHKLEVWPGYVTAVDEYEGGMMMMTDVSHRVLRTETVLSFLFDCIKANPSRFHDEVTKKLIGVTVLTRYNNKTYRVDDIAWDMNPLKTFTQSDGTEISFKDYYKKAYGKVIEDDQQPLLIHRPKKKDLIRAGRRPTSDPQVVCLIPEFSYMTGLSDDIRADFRVMKDLATHTRITPMQRQASLRRFCESVNSHPDARAELDKWGLMLDTDTLEVKGRKMPIERINFRTSKCSAEMNADWGRAIAREKVITAVDLRHWLVVCTKRDGQNAREFIRMMSQVCRNIGIECDQPELREIPDDRTETYLRTIRSAMSPQVQCVTAIFPSKRDDRYNALKKLCCVECPVPSQVINTATLRKKDLRSIVLKIALQINCKMGGELWAVDIPTKGLMVAGIDVYHEAGGKSSSVGAFVASINPSCTRWYSRVAHQMAGQELIDSLKINFVAALRKYHEVNHNLPDRIVIYRDGVGDGQLGYVSDYEVSQLAACFHTFGESYQPKLAMVIVQKRINTRLFAIQGGGRNKKLDNPPPGTVLDHTVTRKQWYDFFLVSQHVRQGTVTPTHYVVVHDTSEWSPDHMQRLSYKMTHLYYNWPGTVRVPAPCQYAHKLAYLVGQNIRKDPSQELCDRLFYL